MKDSFKTIKRNECAEIKIKGSRFIAESFSVRTRPAVDEQIDAIRAREHRATHHCSAFRLGRDGDVFYYDDDGEPSGTAGAPILRQIDGRELTNVLIVVTRYYGGTKLGTGGLARAYGEAAGAVLERSGEATNVIREPVEVQFDYSDTAAAEQVVQQFDVVQQDAEYTDTTRLVLGVRRSDVDSFLQAFKNNLGGRGEAGLVKSEG